MSTVDEYNALGRTLYAQGDLSGALEHFQHVACLQPLEAAAHANVGFVLREQKRFPEALTHFQQALHLAPHWPELYFNVGQTWYEQGNLGQAIRCYQQAIALRPTYADAYYNLGVVYQAQGELTQARLAYEAVLHYQPETPEAYNNLGGVLLAMEELEAARLAYEAALRLQPEAAETHNNLGTVLLAQAHLQEAREHCETAIRLNPEDPTSYNNLGVVLREQGALQAAEAAHEYALQLRPDFAEAWWNCALVWLAQGNLAQGWPAYEWRWHTAQAPRSFPLPLWDGGPLIGRTILVTAEQGVGDALLFASCLPDLLAQAGHVVIACDQRLTVLLRRAFPAATVCSVDCEEPRIWLKQVPPVDVYLPMGSLPLYLRPTLESFPTLPGYLLPDPGRAQQYRHYLDSLGPGRKIGIAWRSLKNRQEIAHYPPLEQWKAVLTLPGVEYINLQYDDPEAELDAAHQRWGTPMHSCCDLDLMHDLEGTAALISMLDVVIGPETTVTALAGALGRPVWRLTASEGSWTSLGTAHCPWFPSMHVVRPQQRGQWADALQRVARDIARLEVNA
ncbi:MAG: tetratricopeptide repeat protein [Candidatus Tectimicrobiota bacterium]